MKKLHRNLMIAGGVGIFSLIMWAGFQPLKGSMYFGICKVFIEQGVTYPDEMRYIALNEQNMAPRVEYVIMNEFGEYQSQSTTCYFKADPKRGVILSRVVTDRREIDPVRVEKFNNGMAAIYAYPPDLTTPGAFAKDLEKLWRAY